MSWVRYPELGLEDNEELHIAIVFDTKLYMRMVDPEVPFYEWLGSDRAAHVYVPKSGTRPWLFIRGRR